MDIRQWVTNFQDIKDVIDTVEYEVRALELNKIRMLGYISYLESTLFNHEIEFEEENFD